ncbi:hypothetical protein PFISCL1PPCAC_25251, partial [Pristionchus fissidentatus]
GSIGRQGRDRGLLLLRLPQLRAGRGTIDCIETRLSVRAVSRVSSDGVVVGEGAGAHTATVSLMSGRRLLSFLILPLLLLLYYHFPLPSPPLRCRQDTRSDCLLLRIFLRYFHLIRFLPLDISLRNHHCCSSSIFILLPLFRLFIWFLLLLYLHKLHSHSSHSFLHSSSVSLPLRMSISHVGGECVLRRQRLRAHRTRVYLVGGSCCSCSSCCR